MFKSSGSKPDRNGMIDGICNGDTVLIFSRDLEDGAESIAPGNVPTSEAPTRRVDRNVELRTDRDG